MNNKKGFTLFEIIVVISIMAIMASTLYLTGVYSRQADIQGVYTLLADIENILSYFSVNSCYESPLPPVSLKNPFGATYSVRCLPNISTTYTVEVTAVLNGALFIVDTIRSFTRDSMCDVSVAGNIVVKCYRVKDSSTFLDLTLQ